MALAGEELISPLAFFHAYEVFVEALKYDSENKRALFYTKLLKPQVLLRGVVARVKPITDLDAELTKKIEEGLKTYDMSAREFLLDGEPDIDNEAKLQRFVDELAAAWSEGRQFMKANKNLKMTLNLPSQYYKKRFSSVSKFCEIDRIYDLVYHKNCSQDYQAMKFKIERTDIEAIQHGMAGAQVYMTAGNAYSVMGGIDMIQKFKGVIASDQMIMDEAKKHAELLTLRDATQLKAILGMGSDALAGANWVKSMQQKLCRNTKIESVNIVGSSRPIKRQGYLLEQGLCIDKENKAINSLLQKIELTLAGDAIAFSQSEGFYNFNTNRFQEAVHKTNINIKGALENPIVDLKAIVKDYNECGDAVSVNDDMLSHIFVNNDATKFLLDTGNLGGDVTKCAAP